MIALVVFLISLIFCITLFDYNEKIQIIYIVVLHNNNGAFSTRTEVCYSQSMNSL